MKQLRIAIAGDNWFVAEHLRRGVVALGHSVVGLARTGQELVGLVTHERRDLVVVEVRLANGSDGLAAARDIHERLAVPAIAATANLTAAEAEAAGLLGLLHKPYTCAAHEALGSGSCRRVLTRG